MKTSVFRGDLTELSKSPAEVMKSNKQLFGIELRSEADCEYPLDDNALSGNDWCLIWKMTKRTKQ